jgi:small redox-active disulfide protein 2
MKIQVLVPECAKCTQLAENATAAVKELGIECELEKITDFKNIMAFGTMIITPGLVVNGEVRSVGRVLSLKELMNLLNFVKKSTEA